MNLNGGLMSKAEIESNYNIKPNFLEYMRVHRCVKPYIGKEKKNKIWANIPIKCIGHKDSFKRNKEIPYSASI